MPPDDTRYETDFYEWTQEQASRLREAASLRLNARIDWENVAEEVESLGRNDFNCLRSRCARIVEHLLKLEYSTASEPRSAWRHSVLLHRSEAEGLLENSPSLRRRLERALARSYSIGRKLAAEGLSVELRQIPADCPYCLDEILDADWFPTNRHGLD